MNKKGQSGFYVMLSLLIVGLVWLVGLSGMVADIGAAGVAAGNLTGLNAFFYSNLNLFIGIAWILSLVLVAKYGF